jgi:tetratricopeptide (TPR) repeat protein
LITPQNGVFLTDFGLAKIAQTGESTLSQDMMVGTPQYISPEQAQGRSDLDVRTDIYSLGVVLYELLVGRVPFQADTPYAVVHDHIFTPLPMPRSLNPALPEPFERVLLKALAKERDDRYASVSDFLSALDKAAAEAAQSASTVAAPAAPPAAPTVVAPVPSAPGEKPSPRAAPAARKSGRTLWIALGGIGLLLLFVAAFLVANRLSGRAQLQNARRLRDQGKMDQALAQYDAAAKANAKLLSAYREPAEILMNRGQPGDFLHAAQWCERGLSVAPDDTPLRMCASIAWLITGDSDNAAPHLDWLIRNRPDDAAPHAGLALVMLGRGQLDAAEDEARRALERDKDSPEGHLALGAVLMKKGQPLLAREQFRIVMTSPTALRWLKERAQQFMNELK